MEFTPRCHTSTMALAALPPGMPTVLVSHFPLTREPTRVLKYPEFAQWCGTEILPTETAPSAANTTMASKST